MRAPRLGSIAMLASCVTTSSVLGQGVASVPGRWTQAAPETPGFTSALVPQQHAIERAILQILGMLKVAPSVARPVGYCLVPTITVRPPESSWRVIPDPGHWPATADATVMVLDHDPEFPQKAGTCRSTLGTSGFDVRINTVSQVFGIDWREPVDSDAAGPFLSEPARADDYRGSPTYILSDGRRVAVLTKRTEPLWRKVTRERFLHALIAVDRQQVAAASANGANPYLANALAPIRARLAAHEKLLGLLSPTERNEQAVLRDLDSADNPFEGRREPMRLVSPNPAFFDRTRPAGDAQLITIDIPPPCEGNTCSIARPQLIKALQEIDWNALAALLR